MIRLFVLIGIASCFGAVAYAGPLGDPNAFETINPNDLNAQQFNPEMAVAPVSVVEGPGVKIGEGSVLRPVFGAEVGYISNVFYTNLNPQPAALLRIMAAIGVSSLGGLRLAPTESADGTEEDLGMFEYRASLRAAYDFLFGKNPTTGGDVFDAGGLNLGASFHGIVNPMGVWSVGIDEDYLRLVRAADFEASSNLNRDDNDLAVMLLVHPHGRSLSGYLYYRNYLDIFEQGEQAFTDRMENTVGAHPMWQVFPQTQVYADVSISLITGLGSGPKSNSYPFVAYAGISTLLTPRMTAGVLGGYANGFYSQGPSYSSPVVGAQVAYRYAERGRVIVGYQWLHNDSINANFYRDHLITATLEHVFDPFTLFVLPELHFRQYSGIQEAAPEIVGAGTRNDVIGAVTAGVAYNFRNWLAATLSYRFTDVDTSYRYTTAGSATPINPSYVDHEVIAGVRLAL